MGFDDQVRLGFSDVAAEGSSVTTDGSPMTLINWVAREPNDGRLTEEDCTQVQQFNAGLWNVVPCDEPRLAVCVPAAPDTCGNGSVSPLSGEECDDHNLDNLDGCSGTCQFEP